MTDPERGPSLDDPTARVVVQATWQGLIHKCEKVIQPVLAKHPVMDKAVWDATIVVRRALAKQRYPDPSFEYSELRNEFEAFGAIRSHCATTLDRFELVPPSSHTTDKWRAYFKKTRTPLDALDPFWIERNPIVGVGSTDYVAIENLLRFTEGREPIDD